jgi:hypothetical protein
MTMRKTGQTSKVLEMRSFYKVWVTSVFAKKKFFMSFSTFVVKYHKGSALKLSQLSCFPHGAESPHGKKMLTSLDNPESLEREYDKVRKVLELIMPLIENMNDNFKGKILKKE